MNRIESFKINHDILTPGVYVSRIDGDVVTYDIRVKVPNGGDYLANPAMHTIEHIFATFVRNGTYSDKVIYFGPMGCRTGFYLLLRDSIDRGGALAIIRDAFEFIADFNGEIPGSTKIECGNYAEHDLAGARAEASRMTEILRGWTDADMTYKE